MTHIAFDIENLFETYMSTVLVLVRFLYLSISLAPVFCILLLLLDSVGCINLFMSMTTLQPNCIMFRRYECDRLSYQHANGKQKHGRFP